MVDFAALTAPFPPEVVSWRVGPTNKEKTKGMALAYIDARDVMERLDEVCGPSGWQCRYPHAEGKTVCEIGIRVDEEWIWKADGAGDTDMEASKGALSDAFKRAAVRWGIGRYLYDTDSPWVAIEPHGRSYTIVKSELPKLRRSLSGERQPAPSPPPAKATGPAPAAPEPTESEKRIYDQLMAGVRKASSATDLDTWKRDPANAELYRELPISLQSQLQAAAGERRRVVSNPIAAG